MTASTITEEYSGPAETAGLFSRSRIIAKAGFNRWLVPPAELAIHLCIGMAILDAAKPRLPPECNRWPA
jgi:hypothetical protein